MKEQEYQKYDFATCQTCLQPIKTHTGTDNWYHFPNGKYDHTPVPILTDARDEAGNLGHDFYGYHAEQIDTCNFCGITLTDSKVKEQCDVSDKFRNAKKYIGLFAKK